MRIDKIREEDLDGEVKTYKLNTIKQKLEQHCNNIEQSLLHGNDIDMYKKGENDQKFNYVLDKVIAMIPMPLQLFISEDLIKQFIQKTFDNLKKALNYQPKKEV